MKRVRREEKLDKDFDMDFGVGELPGTTKSGQLDDAASQGLNYKQDPYMQGSAASLKDLVLQPPPGALPYLVPKANVSRESLHSLSDPRDNPYGVIYSSRPPSPSGAFSPFSDQQSISGRSTRSLLAAVSQTDESNLNLPFKTPSRAPSPLAISEIPNGQKGLSPSKMLAHVSSDIPTPSPAYGSSRSPSQQPVREPTSESRGGADTNGFASAAMPSVVTPLAAVESLNQYPPTVMQEHSSSVIAQYPVPTSPPKIQSNYTAHQISSREVFDSTTGPLDDADHSSSQTNKIYPEEESWKENTVVQQNLDGVNGEVGDGNLEESDDHAKRIQSVYNEYWNDGGYYDGSEEWESLPRQANVESQYQSNPTMTTNYNSNGWRDSAQDYYRGNISSQEPASRDPDYYHDGYPNAHNVQDGVGLGINGHFQSPPTRPSYYSRPSTSYSSSSLPSRARTPSKPLQPLNDLPAERYKLDDLTSPISFSKPRRFVGVGGRASPINRPASPAQVLSSSWSHLAELPVPHRLRRSGSFSSIEFAPVRKYAPSEVDAGDTGSIRSLARTEASLMAVSAGAGQISRLPQDLVPMGKAGALSNLRPQNYENVRYV